jgi:hypothetical protein
MVAISLYDVSTIDRQSLLPWAKIQAKIRVISIWDLSIMLIRDGSTPKCGFLLFTVLVRLAMPEEGRDGDANVLPSDKLIRKEDDYRSSGVLDLSFTFYLRVIGYRATGVKARGYQQGL